MPSWKPEVRVVNDPKFYANALCFATREEAEASACSLMDRWSAVVAWSVVESDMPVNCRRENSRDSLIPTPPEEAA